jgi:hypothetical protein
MALPESDSDGDLPVGTHHADREELIRRFGDRGPQRAVVSHRLEQVLVLTLASGAVSRVIIFGSYVTAKEAPGDVDLLLVVPGDFDINRVPEQARVLFDHQHAESELGAHIFWLRSSLGQELIEQFVTHYAINRRGKQQGVIEVD